MQEESVNETLEKFLCFVYNYYVCVCTKKEFSCSSKIMRTVKETKKEIQ